jgi:Ca2+-binding RTX toxin-like protein
MTIATSQLTAGDVALFFGDQKVFYPQNTNVKLSLQSLGHSVETFDGISSKDFRKALEGVDVLYMPAMSYIPSDAVAYVIRDFVHNGGTLVISNTGFIDYETDFINDVFNTEIVELANADTTTNTKTGDAAGTTFAGDPTPLPDNDYTDAWLTTSLPPGATTLYSNGLGGSTVLAFQHGRGQVVMLGWDFSDAVPNGTQDGGWLQVLHSAISRTDNLPTGSVITGGVGDDVVSTSQSILGQPTATAFDDIVTLSDGNDNANGAGGDDWISGGKGKDKLTGGDGDDVLSGGTQNDKLRGGGGVDDFLFDVKLKKAGLDKLPDYESGVDHLVLSQSVFKKLDEGVLSKKEINKYFDVSGSGKVSYEAGKDSFTFAKIDGDEKLAGGHDLIVVA